MHLIIKSIKKCKIFVLFIFKLFYYKYIIKLSTDFEKQLTEVLYIVRLNLEN